MISLSSLDKIGNASKKRPYEGIERGVVCASHLLSALPVAASAVPIPMSSNGKQIAAVQRLQSVPNVDDALEKIRKRTAMRRGHSSQSAHAASASGQVLLASRSEPAMAPPILPPRPPEFDRRISKPEMKRIDKFLSNIEMKQKPPQKRLKPVGLDGNGLPR